MSWEAIQINLPGLQAGADFTTDAQYRFVGLTDEGVVELFDDTSVDRPVGVLRNNPPFDAVAGIAGSATVTVFGVAQCEVSTEDSGLTAGTEVGVHTDGRLKVASTGDYIVGVALEDGNADEIIPVLVNCVNMPIVT